MPLDALALVGFMDERVARLYFQQRCEPPIPEYPELLENWRAAKAKRGAPMPKAGRPTYRDITEHAAHTDEVKTKPYYQVCVGSMVASFKMVEIRPLLAFQFHVESERVARICGGLSKPPSMQEMLDLCLPLSTREVEIEPVRKTPNGFIVESKNPNFLPLDVEVGKAAGTSLNAVSILMGERPPLVQVVRYDGRCYLKNGYHRAHGLCLAQAAEMPCLFLEASDPVGIGIPPEGAFSFSLLRGSDPPTCGHFTEERAWKVRLRDFVQGYEFTCVPCARLT